MNYNRDISNPDAAPENQHDDHRNYGFSRSPQDSSHTVGERQQEEEERLRPRLARPKGDDLRCIVESGNQQRRKEIDDYPDHLRTNSCTDDAESCALPGAVIFSGPKVLADEGGKRHGEAGNRQEPKTLHLRVCAASGHSHLAELVDICLNKHVRNRNNGILESGGQPIGKNPLQHIFFKMNFPEGNPEFLRASE